MNDYSKLFKSRRVLLTLTIVGILTGVMVWNQGASARPQEDGTPLLSVRDELSGISYDIGVDNLNNELNALINYDNDSVAGIEKFREFNNHELAKIVQAADSTGSIPVRITFTSPFNQEEFTEFVKQHEIEVKNYIIYMLESDGKIATIQGGPSETDLVPTEFFQAATTSISDEYNNSGAKFVGWVEVSGNVQVSRVSQLTNDPQVFLVDVMELLMEFKLTNEVDAALTAAGYGKRARQELINAGYADLAHWTVTWGAYHLGLMALDTQE